MFEYALVRLVHHRLEQHRLELKFASWLSDSHRKLVAKVPDLTILVQAYCMLAASSTESNLGIDRVSEFDFLWSVKIVRVTNFAVAKLSKCTPAPAI